MDTGVDAPARSWAPVPGRLPDELAAAGIAPADVDTVVLTHLHTDHIGWAMGAGGTPYFPNARYLLQAAELGSVRAGQPELVSWLLDPLRATTAPGRPVRTVARALATAATGRGAPPADPAARPAVRQRRPAASASAARTPAASRSVP